VIVVGASISSSEIIHEVLPYAQHPVIGALRGDPVPQLGLVPWTHPHIVIKKQITQFDPESGRIFFEDGSFMDNVDHVIFGTGYTFSLPWIPEVQKKIEGAYRRLPGVYQHTWNIDDPTLTFVGLVSPAATIYPLILTLTIMIARWRVYFPRLRMASCCSCTSFSRPLKATPARCRAERVGD
jgi:hypothetical protein